MMMKVDEEEEEGNGGKRIPYKLPCSLARGSYDVDFEQTSLQDGTTGAVAPTLLP